MIEQCAQEMRDHSCLRDADTESHYLSPRPRLKRSRLDGSEAIDTEEEPAPKRQMVKPFTFAHIKAVATSPPPDLPKLSKSDIAPYATIKSKPSGGARRGPSTVAELLEQERAARAQSRNAPSSPISPAKNRKDSAASNEDTPTSGERVDPAVIERRRLHIHNLATRTKKRDVADFFDGYRVGAISPITMSKKRIGSWSCFADFSAYEQAKRARDDLDRTPLLGRVVDIEMAQPSSTLVDEEEKRKHPLPIKPATNSSSSKFAR